MTRADEFFKRAGDHYLLRPMRAFCADAHVSISPDFAKSFAEACAHLEPNAAFSCTTHDKTLADAARLSREKSVVFYLDSSDDNAARDRLAAALPDLEVRSLLYDVFASETVGHAYDLARPLQADTALSYFILCPPRSGSYFLCDLLKTSGAGLPTEHLRPPHCHLANYKAFDPGRFLAAMRAYGAHEGNFGTKIIYTFSARFFVSTTRTPAPSRPPPRRSATSASKASG